MIPNFENFMSQLGQLAKRCFRSKMWEECVFWCDENLTLLENSSGEDTKGRIHHLLLVKTDTVNYLAQCTAGK